MSFSVTKEQGVRMSITALAAWIPFIPIFWFLLKPVLVTAVSQAMAGEITEQIQKEVAPITGAFTVLIRRDIVDLRKQIAEMEFRKDNTGSWTAADAQELVELELQLETTQEALDALESSG